MIVYIKRGIQYLAYHDNKICMYFQFISEHLYIINFTNKINNGLPVFQKQTKNPYFTMITKFINTAHLSPDTNRLFNSTINQYKGLYKKIQSSLLSISGKA